MRNKILAMTALWSSVTLASGSLIDTSNYQAIAADKKSYRAGEPIVILVVETTTAESSAGTDSRSNTSVEATAYDSINQQKAGLGISGQGSGVGQTSRKGRAFTQLSAMITETLPNNMVRIDGVQNLTINGENQQIRLSGLIRIQDISKDNSIVSHRIAEAKIEILGDGDVTDSQKRSIIFKVLQWLRLI